MQSGEEIKFFPGNDFTGVNRENGEGKVRRHGEPTRSGVLTRGAVASNLQRKVGRGVPTAPRPNREPKPARWGHRAPYLSYAERMVKSSQKLYRFFTDLITGRGRGGWIWLDSVGLGLTELD